MDMVHPPHLQLYLYFNKQGHEVNIVETRLNMTLETYQLQEWWVMEFHTSMAIGWW